MVYVSRIVACWLMSSVVVLLKDGDLVAWVEDSVAVDIPKQCRLDLWVRQEASLRQLDLEVSVVDSVAALGGLHVAEGFEEDSEVVIDLTSVEDEAASDIKVAVALVEEVGMVVVRPMAMVIAQHHPLMHLLVLEEEAALVVGTVALLSTVE